MSWLQFSQASGHIQRKEKDSVLLFEVVAVQHNGSREIFAELIHIFTQGGKRVTLRRFYLDGSELPCAKIQLFKIITK